MHQAEALALLDRSPLFATLPQSARNQLAAKLERTTVAAGECVVSEGEEPDGYYLIAEGTAEVWELRRDERDRPQEIDSSHHALLGRLHPDDAFGEMALVLGGLRTATVRAASDMVLYRLEGEALLDAVDSHAGLAVAIEQQMTLSAIASTLGRSSPFADLSPESLHWLALRLHQQSFAPGESVVREGEPGDALYIVAKGQVEVTHRRADGSEASLGTIGSGGLFGEKSLLSHEVRSATVRALQPTALLRLDREDFQTAIHKEPGLAARVSSIALRRQRPRRIDQWEIERQPGHGPTDVYVLKDQLHSRYLKLSEQGAFLWDLMDGEHSVRDLAVAYFHRFGGLDVDGILRAMQDLHAAGFVHIQSVDTGKSESSGGDKRVRVLEALTPWITREFSIPNPDPLVTLLYKRLLSPLYSGPGQWLQLIVTVAGVAAIIRDQSQGNSQLTGAFGASLFVTIIAYALLVPAHELAHAVTCKHFGRMVHGLGVGWYLFLPVAFADTSDIWMAGRRPRMAVAWAGPYTNFIAGSAAGLVGVFLSDTALRTGLLQFAALSYLLGVLNMNPLVEFDGYYILTDWLGIANLRAKALRYVGALIWHQPTGPIERRLARLYVAYGLLALCYALALSAFVLALYQRYIQGFLSRLMPAGAAELVGWAIACLLAGLILRNVWEGLRPGARQSHDPRSVSGAHGRPGTEQHR